VKILSLRHAEMGSLAVRREWTDWAAPGTSREPISGQQPPARGLRLGRGRHEAQPIRAVGAERMRNALCRLLCVRRPLSVPTCPVCPMRKS
jgi:hypothetical protein